MLLIWQLVYSAICVQFGEGRVKPPHDEDCLYLNVFVPRADDQSALAVMVWIHGGGLDAGYAEGKLPSWLFALGTFPGLPQGMFGLFREIKFGYDANLINYRRCN